jgi:hypothetical protein
MLQLGLICPFERLYLLPRTPTARTPYARSEMSMIRGDDDVACEADVRFLVHANLQLLLGWRGWMPCDDGGIGRSLILQ